MYFNLISIYIATMQFFNNKGMLILRFILFLKKI